MIHSKTFLPVPMTLGSAGLKVLVLMEEILLPGDTMILLKWKFRLPPGHFSLLIFLNQQAKKVVTVLPGVIDPDYEGEIELLLNKGSREEYIWNTGDILCWDQSKWKTIRARLWPVPFKNEDVDHPTKQKTMISWSINWGRREYREGNGKSSY